MMVYSVTAEVKSEFQHKMENFALSRDGFYRKNPDDDFTHGFFAAWPVILLILAGKQLNFTRFIVYFNYYF